MRLHSKHLVLGWPAPAFWLLSAAACDGEPDPVGSGASTGTAGAGGAGDTPIHTPDGTIHVTIPANAIVDQGGEPVTGPVEATIVPLDPTTDLARAPGPLEGVAKAGDAVVGLESLFMAEVTLWKGSQRLQPVPGMLVSAEGTSYQGISTPRVTDAAGTVCMDIKLGGTAEIRVGPPSSPFDTRMVTGSGPAADCDDDCDGTSERGGISLWSKVFGDAGQAVAYSAAIDGAGNVVIAGSFEGTVDFGGGPLASAGVEDIFVAKLDANGNHLWSKVFGDAAHAYSAAIDGAGNVVIAGTFQGTVDFGGGPLAGAGVEDIFVAKLDPNGDHLWSKVFGAAAYQWAYSAALDVAGNVLLTGIFDGTVDFGGGPLASAGAYDVFVAKLDPDGNHLWSRRLGAAGDQWANSAAVDGAGNVVIAGWFQGTVSFGNEPLTGAGMDDIFVAKLTP